MDRWSWAVLKGTGRWVLSDMVRVYDLYGLVIGILFGIGTLN